MAPSGVLIATNAGPGAVVTMRFGLALAAQRGVPAAVVTVAPSDVWKVKERLAGVAGPRHSIPMFTISGAVGPAIADTAATWGAALMVVGLGIGDHRATTEIVHSAGCCVLALSPFEKCGLFERVMLTADFGGSAIAADQCALTLLAREGRAELVHVSPDPVLSPEARVQWSRAYRCAVTDLLRYTRSALPWNQRPAIPDRVLVGDAATVLLEAARREQVDLIALGRHPRRDGALGPVVTSILQRAPCSVLIAP